MLDLEDSTQCWSTNAHGIRTFSKRSRALTYLDRKATRPLASIPALRHFYAPAAALDQAGFLRGIASASLFDVAMVAYQVDFRALNISVLLHSESESADERFVARSFQMIARSKVCRRCHQVHRWWNRIRSVPDGRVCWNCARTHPGA